MRVALIASPFIRCLHGVTAARNCLLRIWRRAERRGIKVDPLRQWRIDCQLRGEVPCIGRSEWPIEGEIYSSTKDLNHTSWAIHDCWHEADIIHLNNIPGLGFARFDGPQLCLHHSSSTRARPEPVVFHISRSGVRDHQPFSAGTRIALPGSHHPPRPGYARLQAQDAQTTLFLFPGQDRSRRKERTWPLR